MTKAINSDMMKEIQKAYYKKDALASLIQNENTAANIVVIDKYTEASIDLSTKMDAMEKEVLGDLYKTFPYTYDMIFAEDRVLLTIDDETQALEIADKMKNDGWKVVLK